MGILINYPKGRNSGYTSDPAVNPVMLLATMYFGPVIFFSEFTCADTGDIVTYFRGADRVYVR